jgi:hypothetical protein
MGMQGDKQQKMTKRSFDRRFYSPSLLLLKLPSKFVLPNFSKSIPFQEPSIKKQFHEKASPLICFLPSLFHLFLELKRKISLSSLYFVDIFPVSVCENIRIKGANWLKGEVSWIHSHQEVLLLCSESSHSL